MDGYLAQQVGDASHREIIGPLLPGTGASGVVVHRGRTVATWGDPDVPEMLFSATKSVLALMAGIAHDRGWLGLDAPVADTVRLPQFDGPEARQITWRHLLQQTSGWRGELWGKPVEVDQQSYRDATPNGPGGRPGSEWAYNDVRVNLLSLALTAACEASLADLLADVVMRPIGASETWRWHGYHNSYLELNGRRIPVVSGGAHWGGGVWMSASDLALIGQLCLGGGSWRGERLISREWFERSWQPCPIRPDYGFLWWLNHKRTVFPLAPGTGVCARGNGGRHLLWIDRERELVVASHWGEQIEQFLAEVSDACG